MENLADFVLADIGTPIQNFVLLCAGLLKEEGTPGLFVALLFAALFFACTVTVAKMKRRAAMLRKMSHLIKANYPEDASADGMVEKLGATFRSELAGADGESLREAWSEFVETTFYDDSNGPVILRNTVRPVAFFNVEDLGFGPAFLRIVPGLFVSTGLALTFLGLIAALHQLGADGRITDRTMADLMTIASAKFIMSLTGLVCSITFTIVLRASTGKVDRELHTLVRGLEKRFEFASLEELTFRMFRAQREAQEAQRKLGYELVAELGRPLKEEVPQAISNAISEGLQPILDKVGQQGTDSLSTMASDLSQQVTSGVERALTTASERIAQAGDRIAQLATRMDESSGRMGSEMDQAVSGMTGAVQELREQMSAAAQSTSGVFTAGAEQLLGVMNQTLEGIRDNTGAGAQAISDAASDMRAAAQSMREEMEGAAKDGAQAAQKRMQEAGQSAGAAIDGAGKTVLSAFEEASSKIAGISGDMLSNAEESLLAPVRELAGQLDSLAAALKDGTQASRTMSQNMRDGAQASADAANTFRTASQDLSSAALPVRASIEAIETAMRSLGDSTRSIAQGAEANAQSAKAALQSAQETLGGQRRAIEAALKGVEELVRRMQGQGDKLDMIDEKLGKAFEQYANQTEAAMQAIRSHVGEMSEGLNAALSTLQSIVDNLQEFQPQQRRS
ncbi:hypothetical protein [Rhodovulum sulfidophilum]|uniref:hypothetical protein n=1 Tax=Rhodovulum sulfidophilum TaxID=35806 RepID=UPI001F37C7FB|nr:hypothetical protein [Rhodovulum sulfidophilum]MCE8438221.1 hypothetical protein [Rhodovulum sulfidophilum]